MSNIELYLGDCLVEMNHIPDHSIDAIIADLPYGTTACAWDSVIPFEALWTQYKRIIKPHGAIVLFGGQPFTSMLIASNIEWFKYCWVWQKNNVTCVLNAKTQPLRNYEDVAIFCRGTTTYNAQNLRRINMIKVDKGQSQNYGAKSHLPYLQEFTNYPRQVLSFDTHNETIHPTQKPVDLLAYFIRTYTNPGETVLDNTMGSGTTGVAARLTGRKFIGMERDENYFDIAMKRITDASRAAQRLPKQLTGAPVDYAGLPMFAEVAS